MNRIINENRLIELLHNYCKKGDKIGVSGSIQVRNYDNSQGQRVYVTEVLVDRIYLLTSRNVIDEQKQQSQPNTYETQNQAYTTPKTQPQGQSVQYAESLTAKTEMDTLNISLDGLPF